MRAQSRARDSSTISDDCNTQSLACVARALWSTSTAIRILSCIVYVNGNVAGIPPCIPHLPSLRLHLSLHLPSFSHLSQFLLFILNTHTLRVCSGCPFLSCSSFSPLPGAESIFPFRLRERKRKEKNPWGFRSSIYMWVFLVRVLLHFMGILLFLIYVPLF